MVEPVSIVMASKERRMAMIATVQAVAQQELVWLMGSDANPDDSCFVIFLRDSVVGYCVFRRSIAEIRRLFILPDHRRRNIGTNAIAQLLLLFRKDGFQSITMQFSDEFVAAFLVKALRSYPTFTVEEGMILVSIT